MIPETFQGIPYVSRETMEQLQIYASLLLKWQNQMNLIGPKTVTQMWQRHFFDSAQLVPFISQKSQCCVDVGSGAGFPGLVLAILLKKKFILIEANHKKSTFLRDVARQTDADVKVMTERIEKIKSLQADFITARALAPLPKLLTWIFPHLSPTGKCVLLKGSGVFKELTDSKKKWKIGYKLKMSRTDPSGRILLIQNLVQKNGR